MIDDTRLSDNARHQAAVTAGEVGRGARLLFKAQQPRRIVDQGSWEDQRDVAPQRRIRSAIDLTHPPDPIEFTIS